MSQYLRYLKKTKLLEIRKFCKYLKIDIKGLKAEQIYQAVEKNSRLKDFHLYVEGKKPASLWGKIILKFENLIDGPFRRIAILITIFTLLFGGIKFVKNIFPKKSEIDLNVSLGDESYGFKVEGLSGLKVMWEFPDKEKLNILVLPPFPITTCNEDTYNINQSIAARIDKIKSESNLAIDLKVDEEAPKGVIINSKTAFQQGDFRDADLVFWTEYEKQCSWDSMIIYTHCINVELVGSCIGDFKYEEKIKIKELSQIIYDGEISKSLEKLSAFGLGVKMKCLKKYKMAIQYFEKLMNDGVNLDGYLYGRVTEELIEIYSILGQTTKVEELKIKNFELQ